MTLIAIALFLAAPSADAYVIGGRHWPSHRIRVQNTTPYRYAVREAMRLWNASGVRLRFVASKSRHANLVIRSSATRATDSFGGCAGQAQLGYVRGWQADMVLDAGCADDALTAKSVAHELGHVLGLGHETRKCAVMNPVLDNGAPEQCDAPDAQTGGVWRCRTLEPDDLAGARRLYGGRPHARRDPMCPIFAAPDAPVAVQVAPDGYGGAEATVTLPEAPAKVAEIAGVSAPDPVLLVAKSAFGCPASDLAEGAGGAERQDFGFRWGADETVDLDTLPTGAWCFAFWTVDALGRRSAPAYATLTVP
jgi:hypothetical protein